MFRLFNDKYKEKNPFAILSKSSAEFSKNDPRVEVYATFLLDFESASRSGVSGGRAVFERVTSMYKTKRKKRRKRLTRPSRDNIRRADIREQCIVCDENLDEASRTPYSYEPYGTDK